MRALAVVLNVGTILTGFVAAAIWAYWALVDLAALYLAWDRFTKLAHNGASLREVHIAGVVQDAHRFNFGVEVICVLLGAVVVALGVLGISLLISRKTP